MSPVSSRIKFEIESTSGEVGLDSVPWARRDSRLSDQSGRILQDAHGIEAPATWSDQAVNIVVRQYLRKTLPNGNSETSIRDLISRVTGAIREFADRDSDGKNAAFQSPRDSADFEKALGQIVVEQKASFNSPVWFNCGLFFKYGVKGNAGNFAWDFASRRALPIANAYERPQSSACFIQSLDDDLNSIRFGEGGISTLQMWLAPSRLVLSVLSADTSGPRAAF